MSTMFKELAHITECPLCNKIFTDPRVLPCIHTYCLKCIQNCVKDKSPGDKTACPLCRKEYTLPENGVEGLPRHFYVEKMIHFRELMSAPCNTCTNGASGAAAKINPAITFCCHCKATFCAPCASDHRKQEQLRDHKLIGIGDRVKPEDLYPQYPINNCEQHVEEALRIYCNECRLVICMMCYVKEHHSHKCSDIHEVVGKFREQLETEVNSAANDAKKCQYVLQQLTRKREILHEQLSWSEREICRKTEQLKQMIDRHEKSLLKELELIKEKRSKEIEAVCREMNYRLAVKESYKKSVNEILEKGAACAIARAASGLHFRTNEPPVSDVSECTLAELGQADVTFKSSNVITDNYTETIGELQFGKDM